LKKLLTYALKVGGLTHVSKVENGYKCGCICPECKEELSAVANIEGKEYEKDEHFSTLSVDCNYAFLFYRNL